MNAILLVNLVIITQILLEPLPVSSSGQVWLLLQFLTTRSWATGLASQLNGAAGEILNLPTLVVLLIFFRVKIRRWWRNVCMLVKDEGVWPLLTSADGSLFYIILANLITFLFYIILPYMPNNLGFFCGTSNVQMLVSFIISALGLSSLYFCPVDRIDNHLSWQKAILLGLAQCLSLRKGISRLGITYVMARWLGLSPTMAYTCSFSMYAILNAGLILKVLCCPAMHLAFWRQIWHPSFALSLVLATLGSFLTIGLSYYLAQTNRFPWLAYFYLGPIIWLSWH